MSVVMIVRLVRLVPPSTEQTECQDCNYSYYFLRYLSAWPAGDRGRGHSSISLSSWLICRVTQPRPSDHQQSSPVDGDKENGRKYIAVNLAVFYFILLAIDQSKRILSLLKTIFGIIGETTKPRQGDEALEKARMKEGRRVSLSL